MIAYQDLGEFAYGGAVTAAEWFDNKRIKEKTLEKDEILKKAGFYTFFVIGITAVLMSSFGWWKKGEKWMDNVSKGFFYDMPRVSLNLLQALKPATTTKTSSSESLAIQQAREIIRQNQVAGGRGTQAGDGTRSTKALEASLDLITANPPGQTPGTTREVYEFRGA